MLTLHSFSWHSLSLLCPCVQCLRYTQCGISFLVCSVLQNEMHPFLRICTYMFSINLKPKGLENSTCDLPSKSIPFAVVPIIINCPITHLENCNIYYFPFSLQNCRFISTSNVPSPYIMHVSYHKYGLSGLSPLTLCLCPPHFTLCQRVF